MQVEAMERTPMPAKYAWAFENPNKNFSDRMLRVQVAGTEPACKERGRGLGRVLSAWTAKRKKMQKQGADGCEVAFELPVCSVVLAGASEFFRQVLGRLSLFLGWHCPFPRQTLQHHDQQMLIHA